jgi:hypothetical protein
MDRTLFPPRLLSGAAFALLACGVAWADEAPRPDAIVDDAQRPRILELDRKLSLPGPIEAPRPIEIRPVGDASGYFGGGSGWNGMPAGGAAPASTTANQRIEASLKKAVARLR